METDWRKIVEAFRLLQTPLNSVIGTSMLLLDENLDDEAERNEYLQLAQRSASYLLEKRNALPNIELLINEEHRFSAEERNNFIRLFRNLWDGIRKVVESMSAALDAIACSPEQQRLLQETHNLALSLLEKNRELLVIAQKCARIRDGHFSTLRTKITDLELLKITLEQLGLTVALNTYIRGGSSERVKADAVAVLDGYCDIGWLRNADGSFDLIADLWGLAQTYNQTELINSINRQYAQNASLG